MAGEVDRDDEFFLYKMEIVNPFRGNSHELTLGVNPLSGGKFPWIGLGRDSSYVTAEQLDEMIIVLGYMKKKLEE
jgi:hypothetical protein